MREDVKIFTMEQGEFLFHMSFKLVDKFMQILEGKFVSEGHLKDFTPIWLMAINDWVSQTKNEELFLAKNWKTNNSPVPNELPSGHDLLHR